MADKVKITYVIEGKDAQKFADKFSKTLGDTEKQAGKATKGIGGFGGSLGTMAIAAGGAAVAVGAIKTAIDWAEQGAAIQQAETALIAYAGGADEAERAVTSVQLASGGLLSSFEATQAASKFMAMGLAENAEEAGELTEMAVTLGSSMGMKAQPAIENFALMLANNSIPRMDSYGMSADKTRVRMEALGKLYPGMTRNQKFLTTVQEQGAEKLKLLADAGYEAGTSFDRLKTIAEDTKEVIQIAAYDAIEPLASYLLDLATVAADTEANMGDLIESFKGVMDEPLVSSWEDFLILLGVIEGGIHDEAEAIRGAEAAEEAWKGAIMRGHKPRRQAITDMGDYKDAVQGVVTKLGAVTDAEIANTLLGELNQQYKDGAIDAPAYASGVGLVLDKYTDLTPAEINARIEFANFTAQLEKDDPALATMETRLGNIHGYYLGLPSRKTSHIYIIEHISRVYEAYDRMKGKKGKAGGGLLDYVDKVGERGWEYVIGDVVIPHGISVQLEQLGLLANQELQRGGRKTARSGYYTPTYLPPPGRKTSISERRRISAMPSLVPTGGLVPTGATPEAVAQAAAEIATEMVEEAVTAAVIGQIQPEVSQQTIAMVAQGRVQQERIEETNLWLARIALLLDELPDEDTMRQIMIESQETGGF